MTAHTNTLLPDHLDQVKPRVGHGDIDEWANYANRRQIERHQALLGVSGDRLEQLAKTEAPKPALP